MTDVGLFEGLAVSGLRALHPDCITLVHMGVNAAGKTVRKRMDGFSLVPDSQPPKYVAAQVTTTGLSKLRDKWLYDHEAQPSNSKTKASDDGDLVKCARTAPGIRQTHSDAKLKIYLSVH